MRTLLSEMLSEVGQLFALNVIVNLLALLFPILEVLCSDLCLEDGYHEWGFHGFSGRNFKMVPLVKPWLFPFTFLPIYYSLIIE